jgi:hypothetical protein
LISAVFVSPQAASSQSFPVCSARLPSSSYWLFVPYYSVSFMALRSYGDGDALRKKWICEVMQWRARMVVHSYQSSVRHIPWLAITQLLTNSPSLRLTTATFGMRLEIFHVEVPWYGNNVEMKQTGSDFDMQRGERQYVKPSHCTYTLYPRVLSVTGLPNESQHTAIE